MVVSRLVLVYGSGMDRVSDLGEVDLAELLGLDLSGQAVERVVEIGRRVDRLRVDGDQPGWAVGAAPPAVAQPAAQPVAQPVAQPMVEDQPMAFAFGTVLDRRPGGGDGLEYALDVWRADEDALLVSVAVEVACFCPTGHQTHTAAETAWTATTGGQLVDALDRAVATMTAWAHEANTADDWRKIAKLPLR